MIALHTFNNEFTYGSLCCQFVQTRADDLLSSLPPGAAQGTPNLGEFLDGLADSAGLPAEPAEPNARQWETERQFLKTAGNIGSYLNLLEEYMEFQNPEAVFAKTQHGVWTHNVIVLQEPTLRERQENMWASDLDYPYTDWKHEVGDSNTTLGYWEWVERQREQEGDR